MFFLLWRKPKSKLVWAGLQMGFLSVALGKWYFLRSCVTTRLTQVHLVFQDPDQSPRGSKMSLESFSEAHDQGLPFICSINEMWTIAAGPRAKKKGAACPGALLLLPQEFCNFILPSPLSPETVPRPPSNSYIRKAHLHKQKFQCRQFPSILYFYRHKIIDIIEV